jgi:transglutaminase-like putative cysteine protease
MKNLPLHLNPALRLSLYLTLFTAALTISWAEQVFVPGVFWLMIPVLGLLAGAFVLDVRGWILPAWAANVCGGLIAAGWMTWILFRLFTSEAMWIRVIPLPAALLPDIGLLVLLLMTVQAFRPKTRRDFWLLQTLAMLLVALGCILAGDPVFGWLMAGYTLCAIWGLTLFYLEYGGQGAGPAGGAGRSLFAHFLAAGRWAGVTAGVAVGLFLLLPRTSQQLNLFLYFSASAAPRSQTGFSALMDLNRTGLVEVDEELAFTVQAEDAAGNPKLDLSGDQRWRGTVLDAYQEGRWHCSALMSISPLLLMRGTAVVSRSLGGAPRIGSNASLSRNQLADLGPDQFFLNFTLEPRKAGGLFLAEPVAQLGSREGAVVLSLTEERRSRGRFYDFQGTLLSSAYDGPREYSYRQVVAPPQEDGISEPVTTIGPLYPEYIVDQPLTELRPWTWQLLQQLAGEGKYGLTAEDARPAPPPPDNPDKPDALPVERWEKAARALTAYLATSGEYSYTLDLQRVDPSLDPTLDFLWNIKQGHCHRYAGGLTLILRSLGIPARIVKGFRGADSLGEGAYAVHQSHAHSWVEALLLQPIPGAEPEMRWLTLDPTPAGDPRAFNTFSWARLWEGGQRWASTFWRDYIVEYSSDQQTDLWASLRDWFTKDANGRPRSFGGAALRIALVAGGLCVALGFAASAGFWVVRRRRKGRHQERRATAPALACYARLLAILARRCGLRPQPAQTPREFGEAARQVLHGTAAAALADVPARAALLLYRVRYGGQALPEVERRDLDEQIDQLEGCLRPGK